MPAANPSVSIAVTARNDDHGGDLLERLQLFTRALDEQCRRSGLNAELLLVEWNPPADRPPLSAALEWPANPSCHVRVLTVPPAVHARYAHAAALPLYQMIAKNAAIRRARGRFVLATNIDVLFSDELVEFLASGPLDNRLMYRIDRTDVESGITFQASISDCLRFAEAHILRVNHRNGIFEVLPDGSPARWRCHLFPAGLEFGSGWHALERDGAGRAFLWASGGAELIVSACDSPVAYELEIEPGPGAAFERFNMRLADDAGRELAAVEIPERCTVTLAVPAHAAAEPVYLQSDCIAWPKADPRILNWKLLACKRCASAGDEGAYSLRVSRTIGVAPRWTGIRRLLRRRWLESLDGRAASADPDIFETPSGFVPVYGWTPVKEDASGRFREAGPVARLLTGRAHPESSVLGMVVESCAGPYAGERDLILRDETGIVIDRFALDVNRQCLEVVMPPGPRSGRLLTLDAGGGRLRVYWCGWLARSREPAIAPTRLHLNACGDFTLMAREHWLRLRGYPEFDGYSMNIDSALCSAAHYSGVREEVLMPPLRAYHIEHSAGSGFTPEHASRLFHRLAALDVPSLPFEQVHRWALEMRRSGRPILFNSEDWGLGGDELVETSPSATSGPS